jgi:AraC-like DNA-binding protein
MSQKRRRVADEPFLLLRTLATNYGAGSRIGNHVHEWHQLVYVTSGLMTVWTEAGSWVAPPSWAVWVPAGFDHQIRFVARSALRTAYLRPEWAVDVPPNCCAVTVGPLLRELIIRATEIGMLDGRDPAEQAIATLIVAELRASDVSSFALPQPTSKATNSAAVLMASGSPEAASIATLAKAVGLATRTFERRFVAETGMTPGRWQQQRVLLLALEQLAMGASVKNAASTAGYGTPSAFIAAFRKSFGATPARYFSGAGAQPRRVRVPFA